MKCLLFHKAAISRLGPVALPVVAESIFQLAPNYLGYISPDDAAMDRDQFHLLFRHHILPGAEDHPEPFLDQSGNDPRQCLLDSDLVLHH